MDNLRGMVITNDWDRYQALQIRLMRQWRQEEHEARMEVLLFEPEVNDVGHDCTWPSETAAESVVVWHARDREIDLGGPGSEPTVPDDGGRVG